MRVPDTQPNTSEQPQSPCDLLVARISVRGLFVVMSLAALAVTLAQTFSIASCLLLGTIVAMVSMHYFASALGKHLENCSPAASRVDRSEEVARVVWEQRSGATRRRGGRAKRMALPAILGAVLGSGLVPWLLELLGAEIRNPLSLVAVCVSGGVLMASGLFVMGHAVALVWDGVVPGHDARVDV